MVVTSFFVAVVGVLAVLMVLTAFNRATHDRGRAKMVRELGHFLDTPSASDNHATGTWRGMPVTIVLGEYRIAFDVRLPHAVIPYRGLNQRHGSSTLHARMRTLGLSIDDQDRMVGSTARENGLAESIITLEDRIKVAAEVAALRGYAPRELIAAIDASHSTREVDEHLGAITTFFPDCPERAEALARAAAHDEHGPASRRVGATG
ncbi:MAG: hypothetical protein JNJ59_09000 [Deltaproteobacteria bacterium]|nr:hypothetical protein [Deltaproteobacteria bacterium]